MWRLLAKGTVSALLIWFLFRNRDVGDVARRLVEVGPIALIGSIVTLVVLQFPAALRWMVILRTLGYSLGLRTTLTLVLIGQFFSQVLPSSIGGDAVRIWEVHRVGLPGAVAISSVLIDRIVGLMGLVILVVMTQPVLLTLIADRMVENGVLLLIALSCVGVALALVLDRFTQTWLEFRPFRMIAALSRDLRSVLLNPRAATATLVISVCYQAGAAAVAYILANSLGLSVGFLACLAIVPLAGLATLLPISIAGWGLRETAFVFLFGLIGIPASQALALSILFGLLNLIAALSGAVAWLIWRAQSPTDKGTTSSYASPKSSFEKLLNKM